MPNTILLKKSSTAAAAPTAGQLSAGELAINTADGKLFAKNSAGTVVNLPVTSISGQTITPGVVGVGTTTPQTPLQVIADYDYDSGTDTFTPTSSTLPGLAQTEIFQVISGGYDPAAPGALYDVNLGRFHVNGIESRGSFSLSNAGSGAWENNVLQMFVHGSGYPFGHYGGNASDAGCAMIVTRGADITKLQIGNYDNAPIEFFTNNTKQFKLRTDGNFDLYKNNDAGAAAGNAFVWYNTFDNGFGEIGELAAIQMRTGGAATTGNLVFYTAENSNAVEERVRIDEYGKVGIGTSAPGAMLDVAGNVSITGNLTVTGTIPAHTHGNLTNDGKIGSTSGLVAVTTTSGALTTLAQGTAGQVLKVNAGATAVEWGAGGGSLTAAQQAAIDLFLYQNFT